MCVRRHLTSLQLNLSPEFEAVVGVIKWPRFDLPTGCLSNCRILVGIGNQLLWHDWLTHQLVFRLKAQMYVDHVVHDGHYICADFHQWGFFFFNIYIFLTVMLNTVKERADMFYHSWWMTHICCTLIKSLTICTLSCLITIIVER